MPPKSRRVRREKPKKTRRIKRKGGADPPPAAESKNDRLKKIIDATKASPVIVNPASKFVVVTYWWGGDNKNANTQRPCPEDIGDLVKDDMMREQAEQDPTFKALDDAAREAEKALDEARKAGQQPTPEQQKAFNDARRARTRSFKDHFMKPEVQANYKSRGAPKKEELIQKNDFCQPATYREMIKHWESSCRRHNCNYMAVEYPEFAQPGGYQLAINAKPLFIKKALDLCNGRGVLYIDGDMFVNKYPRIFDFPNVDFMARNWNSDPRSKDEQLDGNICFDPYIFETSGGTMFFADTPMSRRLLDDWWTETADPKSDGKADDRILSMVQTMKNQLLHATSIHLPIEYLWLTDLQTFQEPNDASLADSILEHPDCLTGEERASELSVSTVTREPIGQDKDITDMVQCERTGGFIQEYIFFPTQEDVETMKKFLEQAKNAENADGDNPFQVVNQDNKQGTGNFDSNPVAADNEAAIANETVAESAGQTAQLGQDATPAQIVARLKKGVHVSVGGGTEIPNIEFVATFLPNEKKEGQTPKIQVDVSKPMFIHSGNPIIHHLLMMCKTLGDINKHLKGSFMFASRIRWSSPEGPFAENTVPSPPPAPSPAEPTPVVPGEPPVDSGEPIVAEQVPIERRSISSQ